MMNKIVANSEPQHRALKLRIYPNPEQTLLINKTFGCCRQIYNTRLYERNQFYNDVIKVESDKYNDRQFLEDRQPENKSSIKNGKVFLYFETRAQFISAEINNGKIRILPQTPSLADLTESRPVTSNIAQNNDLSSPQSMVQNGKTYGMATVNFWRVVNQNREPRKFFSYIYSGCFAPIGIADFFFNLET